jgi:outer membrane immunogenic protein
MRKLAIAAVAMAFTGSAYAADMPLLKAPPPLAAPNWTGLYIGVNGGGVWGRTDTGVGFLVDPYVAVFAGQTTALGSSALNNSGGLAGGQIGYLLQSGSVVGGFEASLDWSGLKAGATKTATNLAPVAGSQTWTENVSSTWLALFTARVGFDMGSWYPYLIGGIAVSDIKYAASMSETSPSLTSSSGTFNSTRVGFGGGGGIEWRWDSHWSLRGEYLFIEYTSPGGIMPIVSSAVVLPAGSAFTTKATVNESLARAALSYKF